MEQTTRPAGDPKTVVIVGGGASGSLVAYHLSCQKEKFRIIIVEPAPRLALGLAYPTSSLRHLLNVPAGKISALANDPEHFLAWLQTNHDPDATPATFSPRAIFGLYLRSILSNAPEPIEHMQVKAIDCRAAGNSSRIALDSGAELEADYVVIATGNFEPAPLKGVTWRAEQSGVYVHNAWLPETYQVLPQDAPIVLIGSGLTAIDVVLRLREIGHRGTITMISRRGVLPSRHTEDVPVSAPSVPLGTSPTCRAYLRSLRGAIRQGADWRATIDSLRAISNQLWLALPIKEQKRFRRHLQRRWDVVRHRMASTVADFMENELRSGRLVIREGQLENIDLQGDAARVTFRHGCGAETIVADRVINCTGPSLDYCRGSSSLLRNLLSRGTAAPGPLGSGLNTTADGALMNDQGAPSTVLFAIGPPRQGTLLESIAIPEIRDQAVALAEHLTNTAHPSATNRAA